RGSSGSRSATPSALAAKGASRPGAATGARISTRASGAAPRSNASSCFLVTLAQPRNPARGARPATTTRPTSIPPGSPPRLSPPGSASEPLGPGTVHADPYGRRLVGARRLPQTASDGGLLLAVDAQPDGTVARKRYWRGNFLFVHDPTLGSPGFKHFRPVVI